MILRMRVVLGASLLFLCATLTVGSGVGVTGQASPVQVQDRLLADRIHEYLSTQDSEQAVRLLDGILRNPAATVARIEDIIKTGPAYTAQPVGILRTQPVRVRGHQFWYGLYVPPSYSPTKEYALVLCLHGAGFSGDSYLERWRARLGDDYILACPTFMAGAWWTRLAEELVLATIGTVQARYRIDPDRVFLTGMSNGGIGAWIIGFHHAPTFAGLAPMASGIDDVLFPFLENLRHTPAYIIHGRRDQVMPVKLSRSIAKTLSDLGYTFTYQEHDRSHPMAGGHFFPREELPDLVSWLGAQRRVAFPRDITVVRDATHLTAFGWVRIDTTDRIAAFAENLIEGRDEFIVNKVYARLEASIVASNRIEVRTQRVRRYTLFLNRHLVDLSQPVTVLTNGEVSYHGRVHPDVATLLREARRRQDPTLLFPVLLSVSVDSSG